MAPSGVSLGTTIMMFWYLLLWTGTKTAKRHQLSNKTEQKSQMLETTKTIRNKAQEIESHKSGLPLTEHNSKLDILNAVASRHCECCG